MTTNFKQAYDDWNKVEQILDDALENAPEQYIGVIEDGIAAVEALITDIEDRELQESEKAYKPIVDDLGKVTSSLQSAEDDAKAFIAAADKADQLLALLGKLMPLLA
jgi:hypothetical protein